MSDAPNVRNVNPDKTDKAVRTDRVTADRQYQTERAAILSSAVGRARLHLREDNPGAAQEALDTAALETRQLLERLLPLFDTDRLALPEEAVDGI